MKKRGKRIQLILAVILVLQAAWIAFCGWRWGWGPFHKLSDFRYRSMPGNGEQYAAPQELLRHPATDFVKKLVEWERRICHLPDERLEDCEYSGAVHF